jgi:hypothetical protein
MRTFIFSLLMIANVLVASAQVEVTTSSFDLESQKKHKNWRIGDAGIESGTGNVFVKFFLPNCDVTKSSDFSYNYTTFNGISWKVDKLIFDAGFNYVDTKSTLYQTTREALFNNEHVFGKKYNPLIAGAVVNSLVGTAAPSGPIDNSFMFTTIVSGFAAVTGFKIGKSFITTQLSGEMTKLRGDICAENPVLIRETTVDSKEAKGQMWIPVFNHPVPNGGHILFNTVGVIKEEKQHYIFRKYDKNANIVLEKTFTFDYQCIITSKVIEKAPGEYDYVFVAIPIHYKKSKIKVAPASNYEFFLIDGSNFEIKERLAFTAPKSQWVIDQVIRVNDATYLVGACSAKNTEYADIFAAPKDENYHNLQVVKIQNGKLIYAKSALNNELKKAVKTTAGLKSESSVHTHMIGATLNEVNGNLVYQGQQHGVGVGGVSVMGKAVSGPKVGPLQAFVFDSNGDLSAVLSKQEKESARSYVTFSKDGRKFYWLLEDVGLYNELKGNLIIPKKAKEQITALSVLTYDFGSRNITKFQEFANDEWAINYKNPILMDSDDSLLLLGNKITRKAKDSEIVFVTVRK